MPDEPTFTFKLVFAGLCTYVPNYRPFDQTTAFCVLLPKLTVDEDIDRARRSLDGRFSLLNHPHVPLLKYEGRHRVGLPRSPLPVNLAGEAKRCEVVTRLDRRRLWFSFDGDADEDYALDVSLTGDTSFEFVADLERIVPGRAEVDRNAFNTEPGACSPKVGTQIFIDQGRVAVENLHEQEWIIPTVLGGQPYRSRLAQQVSFSFDKIREMRIHMVDLDDEHQTEETLRFVGEPNEEVVIRIGNYCSENPLEWLPLPEWNPVDDVDFVWNYELLSNAHQSSIRADVSQNQQRLAARIAEQDGRGESAKPEEPKEPTCEQAHQQQEQSQRFHEEDVLPYPRPGRREDGTGYPSGDNCDGVTSAAYSEFKLP